MVRHVNYPFSDAIKETKDGVTIDFYIVAGAKNMEIISGYNIWRKRIEAKLSQDAVFGKANKELIDELASLFVVSSNSVKIVSGLKRKQKTIKVYGVKTGDIERIIYRAINSEIT